MANNTELQIRITADEKNVVGAFRRLKSSVTDLKTQFAQATASVGALVKEANTGKLRLLDDAKVQAGQAAENLDAMKRQLIALDRIDYKAGRGGLQAYNRDIVRAHKAIAKASVELDNHNAKVSQIGATAATALPQYAGRFEQARNAARGFKQELEQQSKALDQQRRAIVGITAPANGFIGYLKRLNEQQSASRWFEWNQQARAGGVALRQFGDVMAGVTRGRFAEWQKQAEAGGVAFSKFSGIAAGAERNMSAWARQATAGGVALKSFIGLTAVSNTRFEAWRQQAAGGGAALAQLRGFSGKSVSIDARPVAQGLEQTGAAAEKAQRGLGGMAKEFGLILKYAVAYKAVNVFVGALADIPKLADEYANLKGRLAIVTGSQQELGQAMADVSRIALQTGSDVNATGSLYQRLITNSRQLGLSQQEVAQITETVNKTYVVSGASAQEAAGSVRQLQQALASGVLRGDEFNSVMENAPRLMEGLAETLGVTQGELRAMAHAGQLSSKVVAQALLEMRQSVDRDAAAMPLTIGRAVQNLSTQWEFYIGRVDEATGASHKTSAALQFMADHIGGLSSAIATLATGALTLAIVKWTQMTATRLQDLAITRAQIIAENQLAAARARAVLASSAEVLVRAKATADLATAGANIAKATTAAGLLGRAMGFLGGPIGAIITLLTTGAALWLTWGDSAKKATDTAAQGAETAAKRLESADAELKKQRSTVSDDLDAEARRIADLRAKQAGLGAAVNGQGFAVLPQNATAEDRRRLTDWYKLQGQIVTASKRLDQLQKDFAEQGIRASTRLFIDAGITDAKKAEDAIIAIRERFEREKAKLNVKDPKFQETLRLLEQSRDAQIGAATPKQSREDKDLAKQTKAAIESRIDDFKKLGEAAREAWQKSLESEKDYLAESAALRAQANAVAVDTSTPQGQAEANLALLVERQKLERLVTTPGTDYQVIKTQADAVRDLAKATQDEVRAKEILKETNLAQARGAELAAAQEKTAQEGLREEWKKSEQVVIDLQTALEAIGKGTAIKIESEQAKVILDEITAKLAEMKDKTVTVKIVTIGPTGQPLDNLTAAVPAKASGGPIVGPGGPRSDKVLMLGSNGEHMLTAAEVQAAGGHGAVYRLRQAIMSGLLPRFANGGAVMSSMSSLPAAAPVFPHLGRIDLGLGGASYPVYADADVAGAIRLAALKRGGR